MAATRTLLALALLGAAGCASDVDTSGLEPTGDYRDWYRLDATGEAPGHGDTYRIMYANDTARSFDGAGLYPTGTVIIKEVYDNDDGQPGELRYIALMRKLEEAPPGGELQGRGWLFTMKSDEGASETYRERCWTTCHQNSPYDGTFFNWSSTP